MLIVGVCRAVFLPRRSLELAAVTQISGNFVSRKLRRLVLTTNVR